MLGKEVPKVLGVIDCFAALAMTERRKDIYA